MALCCPGHQGVVVNTSWRHFRLGVKVAKARLLKRRIPFFVQLMPTSRCNLNCKYCFAQFHEREGAHFPLPQLLKVIDGLAALGTRFIMVTGGEPMMYPDIAELLQRICSHKIECLLNTNGMRVAERMDEVDCVDIFSISLDGPKEIHDYYRGAGTYEIALEAVKAARAKGIRVQLQFTMTRDLINAFQSVHEIAEELGCFIGVNFLRPQKQAGGEVIEPGEATEGEIREFLDWLIKERPRRLPYPRRLLEYVSRWPYDFSHHIIDQKADLKGFEPIPCSTGRFLISIDNKGNIYPCTKWFYSRPLASCADGNIERAWHQLEPVNCQACLDLGCNFLNDTLRFHPSSLFCLLSVFERV